VYENWTGFRQFTEHHAYGTGFVTNTDSFGKIDIRNFFAVYNTAGVDYACVSNAFVIFVHRLLITRMSTKVQVGVVIFVIFVVVLILFLMSTDRLKYRQLCIIKSQLTQTRRRYSTSDEMRYILYGDGNQFSLYDPQLSEYIRSHISGPSLTPPRFMRKYVKTRFPSMATFVDKLLSGRRNGFFVECGAADGEILSNSLFFELKRNWTRLLIEPNPDFYRAMLNKHRRAYVLRSCLSTQSKPATAQILPAGVLGGILSKMP